jgi:hypothetical protein
MPEPPFQNDMRPQGLPPRAHLATAVFAGSGSLTALLLTVTRPEEIPAALAQGKPVLIDIPAVQWRLRWLATVQEWGGSLVWWLVKLFATLLLTQWFNAQMPTKDFLIPDWAKFDFLRQPDNKIILSPHEE